MENKIKIFVATPTHTRTLDLGFVDSIFTINNMNLKDPNSKYDIQFHFHSGSLINRCRNEILSIFMNSDFDYMFFIDSDITDFVNCFYNVVERYLEIEKIQPHVIVGGVYPIKQLHNYRLNLLEKNGLSRMDSLKYLHNYNINFLPTTTREVIELTNLNKGWVEVLEIGGGFQMFSKRTIRFMIEEYPECKYLPFDSQKNLPKELYNLYHSYVEPEGRTYLSEDYGFCRMLRQAGGHVYANLLLQLGHRGSYMYNGQAISQIVWMDMEGKEKRENEEANKLIKEC